MKKSILIVLILSLVMVVFAQKVQQQTTTIIKPQKKISYKIEYYNLLEKNETLTIKLEHKHTKVNKIINQLKAKNRKIKKLTIENAKLHKKIAKLQAALNARPKKKNPNSPKAQQQ